MTTEDIRILLEEARAGLGQSSPLAVTYAVSFDVLGLILGHEWARRNVHRHRRDPLLDSDKMLGPTGLISFNRVVFLGHHLFAMQHVAGFRAMARQMRSRELVGACAELQVACWLRRAGHDVRFVEPSGRRGDDYDLHVSLAGRPLAIEVKAKRDETHYSETSLRNSLADARQQLPTTGPGIAVIQLPPSWPRDPLFAETAESVIRDQLRRSRRVNAFVAIWHAVLPLPKGHYAVVTQYRQFLNDEPRTPIDKITALITSLAVPTPSAVSRSETLWDDLARAKG